MRVRRLLFALISVGWGTLCAAQTAQPDHFTWLKTSADAGDVQAAWSLAQLLAQADGIEADVDLQLRYLTMAAQAGMPEAQVALGQVYERGALVRQDLEQARAFYAKAAQTGDRAGLIRLVLLLDRYQTDLEGALIQRAEALRVLIARPNAPGWAYASLAETIELQHGRWAQPMRRLALYERAAALGDATGTAALAELLLASRDDEASFVRATDLLAELVTVHGKTHAAKRLVEAYLCKAPRAPMIYEADYWRAEYASMRMGFQDLTGQAKIARLQSQALEKRASALAVWVPSLGAQPAAQSQLWANFVPEPFAIHSALSQNGLEARRENKQLLSAAWHLGGEALVSEVARGLLREVPTDGFLETLNTLALNGSGAALNVLAEADPRRAQLVLQQNAKFLAMRGDFQMLLQVIPQMGPSDQAQSLANAISIMACDYQSALAVATTAARIGETTSTSRFLVIAGELAEGKPWAQRDLGRAVLQLEGLAGSATALDLFESAFAAGDRAAGQDMVRLLRQRGSSLYDPIRARELEEVLQGH